MGKKSSPKAPPAPDPVATANAQAEANTTAAITQANLNRINQVTPEGSITYNQIGTYEDGTPRYEQVQTYSPEQQALYDQQNQTAQALGNLALGNIERVTQAQQQPFNFDNFIPIRGAPTPGEGLQYGYDTGQPLQSSFNGGQPLQGNVQAGELQRSYAGMGPLTYNVDFGPTDFNATSKAAADAVYQQAASRLDPQYAQLQSQLEARLANSGVASNSAAYQRAMDDLGRQRSDAYNQATYSSIGAGLAAQNQGFQQQYQRGQFGLQNAALNNAAQQQFADDAARRAGFWNTAQEQEFNQGMQNAGLWNAARGQQYQQDLGMAQFFNQAQQAQAGMNAGLAAFGNQARGQAYNEALAGSTMDAQQRQQQIEEATYLRNLPLNDIAALLGTGGGIQQPNFSNFAQVGVAAPDYQGAVYANYNAANQQYLAEQQARSQGLGSIFGLAGSLGSAAILASDVRVKENIKRIGVLVSGIPTYVFNYIGDKAIQFGVMAQEVLGIRPSAVLLRHGIMHVDYGKVW